MPLKNIVNREVHAHARWGETRKRPVPCEADTHLPLLDARIKNVIYCKQKRPT